MNLHYLQHVPFEDPAHILTWATSRGVRVTRTRLYANDPLPRPEDFDLLVVMGGPMGVHDTIEYPWQAEEKACIRRSIDEGKRLLGVCLGAQLIADVLGAPVTRNAHKEIGWFPVHLTADGAKSSLLRNLPAEFTAFHWHGDTFGIPAGAIHAASSDACDNQAFVYKDRVLGLQFHLESTATSIDRLIDNCRQELRSSLHIQSEVAIRGLVSSRMAEINRYMDEVLDGLSRSGDA